MLSTIKLSLTLFSLLFTHALLAQDKTDNYSFMKLYVVNESDEVLLVKWEGEWELAGSRYNDPLSVTAFLDRMAADMGVTIQNHKLCGVYTQRWQGAPYLTLMQYYQATYAGGELKVPDDCTDIRWFSYEKALEVIPYENMKRMMREIREHPGRIIGAAFERYQDENNQTQYVTLEDWYLLN
ncbi:NUDIX hydrolase [Tunicatimonas pelagia]|uniref:NUDIX hydrolase n=1 Tax=Tunicatimonas pelagia TaxID=931531 RepID=UPI002666266F|nr:hypothetical protein [Tunicatimonas pelagia]WKN42570.1 hypothetical protein P0M28_26390 [Tunicatimonas pelagia]